MIRSHCYINLFFSVYEINVRIEHFKYVLRGAIGARRANFCNERTDKIIFRGRFATDGLANGQHNLRRPFQIVYIL